MDFFEKYRPKCLADIAGQSRHVAWLRDQVRSRRNESVLLSGPTGSGKTSAGLAYARAILCEQPLDGDCCGRCEPCVNFEGLSRRPILNFHKLECGENGTIEAIKDTLKTARISPLGGRRRIFVFDEVHGLSRTATDALLRVMEQPPKWTRFILLTDQPQRVSRALRSRLHQMAFNELTAAEGCKLLRRVCAAEQLPHDDGAIGELFKRTGGSARDLLRAIESLMPLGAVTTETLLKLFDETANTSISAVINSVMKEDFAALARALLAWSCPASDKARSIHDFMVSAYLRFNQIDEHVGARPDPTDAAAVAVKAVGSATILSTAVDEYWEQLLGILAPSATTTDAQLLMVLKRASRFLNPLTPTPLLPTSLPKDARTFRPVSSPTLTKGRYLNWADIRPFWDMGTFLPQHHGTLFNVRVSISADLSFSHREQTNLVIALTHKLGMQIRYWNGGGRDSFHWMVFYESCPDRPPAVRLLMSIPDHYGQLALHWLKTKFIPEWTQMKGTIAFQVSSRFNRKKSACLQFHWQSIRLLSRSLDPSVMEWSEDGRRQPLVDLLRIPARWRAEYLTTRKQKKRGQSATLTPLAMKRAGNLQMPLLSAVEDRVWGAVDQWWVLEEYEARRLESGRRQAALDQLSLNGGIAGEPDDKVNENERMKLEAGWTSEPKQWPRRWIGWWHPRRVRASRR